MNKRKVEAALIIDPWWSYCGACGKNADPNEKTHAMRTMQGVGCHAIFTHTTSHYSDFDGLYDDIRKMRPDLDFQPAGLGARGD